MSAIGTDRRFAAVRRDVPHDLIPASLRLYTELRSGCRKRVAKALKQSIRNGSTGPCSTPLHIGVPFNAAITEIWTAMAKCIRVLLALSITSLFFVPRSAYAAEIKVLSDGPLESALVRIAEVFRHDTPHEVKFVFGLSPLIHRRASEGETADVIIIQPEFLDDLVKAGKVVAGEHPVIGRVGIGLAVRAEAPARDIATPEALKQVLLNADSLVFNNVASGNYFAKVLDRLGIAEEIKGKITRTSPADVITRVVQGKGNDVGVGAMTQIISDKRLKLVGILPSELQSYLVYTAAPMANSQSPETAKEFIRFLASPQSKDAFAATGVN
jgi:molybdate transport system substrate-binding protein